ncbi:MAG: hypothetical protein KatS3mg104_2213 [Phycisphaerae bacterium]|jgi:hypothetical protein|nr:MAG: hypothetical protein KatS3mg104_2213 [Phycisphaerae bacterium]
MNPRLLILTLFVVGCGPSVRSYSIVVKNESNIPMTVWLTKDGPPPETGWLSPEQIAMTGRETDDPISGVIIPPGKTAEIPSITGRFASGTQAVLRVYHGQKLFNDLLAASSGSASRTDVRLTPGPNQILIDASGVVRRQ